LLFIKRVIIYSHVIYFQVVVKSDAWTEEEKKLKDLSKHEKNLAGLEVELSVFQKFQSGLGKVDYRDYLITV